MKEEIAVENLREIKEILDRFGVEYWLDWGTLLGAVRDGRIIEWDNDIDLGMMSDSWEKIVSALPEFEKKGFDVLLGKFKIYKDVFERAVYFHRFEYIVGLSLYQIRGESAFMVSGESANLTSRSLKNLCFLLSSPRPYGKSKWNFVVKILKHGLSLLPPKSTNSLSDVLWWVWRRSGVKFILIAVPRHYFEKLGTMKFYGMTFNIPSDAKSYLKYKYGKDWKTPRKRWDWTEDGAVTVLTA